MEKIFSLPSFIGLLRELISIINERIDMNFFFLNETVHSCSGEAGLTEGWQEF